MKTSIHKIVKYSAIILILQTIVACQVISGEQRPGQYLDDSHITARVKNALLKSDRYYSRIHVETDQGDVLLSGFVIHRKNKAKAVRIAKSVPGVRSVQDAITIKRKQ